MSKEAKIIIMHAEELLFGRVMAGMPDLIRNFFTGFYYIAIGVERFFLPIMKFIKMLIALLILAALISFYFNQEGDFKRVLIFFSIIIPISLVVFARPNTYCFDMVSSKQISELADVIQANGMKLDYELTIFREVIELAKNRVEQRNKHYYWLFVTYVGSCIFMLDLIAKFTFKIGEFDLQAFIDAMSLPVILFLLFTPIFFVSVHSYKKANDAVFQLIKLSICEVQYRIFKQSATNKRKKRCA